MAATVINPLGGVGSTAYGPQPTTAQEQSASTYQAQLLTTPSSWAGTPNANNPNAVYYALTGQAAPSVGSASSQNISEIFSGLQYQGQTLTPATAYGLINPQQNNVPGNQNNLNIYGGVGSTPYGPQPTTAQALSATGNQQSTILNARPDYTPVSKLGNAATQSLIGQGYTPQQALSQQINQANQSGNTVGAAYFTNALNKATEDYIAIDAESHFLSVQSGIPTAPTPTLNYLSDLALIMQQGTGSKTAQNLAPITSGAGLNLPNGQGIQDVQWANAISTFTGKGTQQYPDFTPAANYMAQEASNLAGGVYSQLGLPAYYSGGIQQGTLTVAQQDQIATQAATHTTPINQANINAYNNLQSVLGPINISLGIGQPYKAISTYPNQQISQQAVPQQYENTSLISNPGLPSGVGFTGSLTSLGGSGSSGISVQTQPLNWLGQTAQEQATTAASLRSIPIIGNMADVTYRNAVVQSPINPLNDLFGTVPGSWFQQISKTTITTPIESTVTLPNTSKQGGADISGSLLSPTNGQPVSSLEASLSQQTTTTTPNKYDWFNQNILSNLIVKQVLPPESGGNNILIGAYNEIRNKPLDLAVDVGLGLATSGLFDIAATSAASTFGENALATKLISTYIPSIIGAGTVGYTIFSDTQGFTNFGPQAQQNLGASAVQFGAFAVGGYGYNAAKGATESISIYDKLDTSLSNLQQKSTDLIKSPGKLYDAFLDKYGVPASEGFGGIVAGAYLNTLQVSDILQFENGKWVQPSYESIDYGNRFITNAEGKVIGYIPSSGISYRDIPGGGGGGGYGQTIGQELAGVEQPIARISIISSPESFGDQYRTVKSAPEPQELTPEQHADIMQNLPSMVRQGTATVKYGLEPSETFGGSLQEVLNITIDKFPSSKYAISGGVGETPKGGGSGGGSSVVFASSYEEVLPNIRETSTANTPENSVLQTKQQIPSDILQKQNLGQNTGLSTLLELGQNTGLSSLLDSLSGNEQRLKTTDTTHQLIKDTILKRKTDSDIIKTVLPRTNINTTKSTQYTKSQYNIINDIANITKSKVTHQQRTNQRNININEEINDLISTGSISAQYQPTQNQSITTSVQSSITSPVSILKPVPTVLSTSPPLPQYTPPTIPVFPPALPTSGGFAFGGSGFGTRAIRSKNPIVTIKYLSGLKSNINKQLRNI